MPEQRSQYALPKNKALSEFEPLEGFSLDEMVRIVSDELNKKYWTIIYSWRLYEPIILTKVHNVHVPPPYQNLVKYCIKEIIMIKPEDDLEAIHKVKKQFRGTLVEVKNVE